MRSRITVLCLWATGLHVACDEPATPQTARAEATVPPFLLARHPESLVLLELPDTNRPGGEPAPTDVPVVGPYKLVRTSGNVQSWRAPLPFRSRKFFYGRPPPGGTVSRGAKGLKFVDGMSGAKRADTWDYSATELTLRRASVLGPPSDGDYTLTYERATEREDGLNRKTSTLDDKAFALRSLQLGDSTRTGVYLPAPALAAWEVVIPEAGVLTLDAMILPPEVKLGVHSDGATLVVELDLAGTITPVATKTLQRDDLESIRIDLAPWAGQRALLRLRTEPGESATLDYVFLAEPALYTPVKDPRRILLVFADTLRSDHLGTYGYERDTTPRLDAWSSQGVVFEQARTVAPWTLPSARTVLSGHQPERWRTSPQLQERLASGGWATGAFVGNIYLSTNFDMADGWSQHHSVNWPPAERVIAQLENFLDRHPDRDAMAMLHLMDMHLPYNEPRAYRSLWAGDPPRDFDASHTTRTRILKAHKTDGALLEQYLIDRYDQNLRYLDDQLGELFEGLGPDTAVMLFADHGEEFWDHGSFEHGHSLHDELLRVPLILRAPEVPAGRVEVPVSLLDVAPTVMSLAGLPAQDMTGRSLLPAASGDAKALASLESRPQPVGRPLYGLDRWGVILASEKWTTHAGSESLYDLLEDPKEEQDLSSSARDTTAWHARLGQGLGTWSGPVVRLNVGSASRTPKEPLILEISSDQGFQSVWLGEDPMSRASATTELTAEGVARVTFAAGARGEREVYARAKEDPTALNGLSLRFVDGETGEPLSTTVRDSPATPQPDGEKHVLMKASGGRRNVTVTYGIAAEPPEDGEALDDAFDSEVEEALKALGYVE